MRTPRANPITRPLSRKTKSPYAVLYPKARQVVVTIKPGDLLEFRELGRRARFDLPIERAFRYAVEVSAARTTKQGRLVLI